MDNRINKAAKYLFFISRPYFPSPGLEEVKVNAAGKTDGLVNQ